MYYHRHIEAVVQRMAKRKSVIVLTGARQVGKSTMLKEVFHNINYVTLNRPLVRESAKDNPSIFFDDNKPPVIVDENVSDSLAGRAGIIKLLGLSVREIAINPYREPFLPTPEHMVEAEKESKAFDYTKLITFKYSGKGAIKRAGYKRFRYHLCLYII